MTKMREKNGIYERQPFELFAYHDKKPTLDHSVFHFHNNYEILLYVKGNLEIYIEQSRYLPVPGTMIVISTEEVHKGTILDSEDYERYVIHVSSSVIQPLLGYDVDLLACFHGHEPGKQNAVVLSMEEIVEFCELFSKLKQILDTEPYGKEVLKISCVAQLMTMVNHAFSHTIMPARPVSNLASGIMDYVENHMSEPLSLESIAAALFMDKYYLAHQFKKQTGDSLYHFILMKRIALARRLLGEGLPVTEVCDRSGFNNYNNFIRTFRKYVNMSPGEYRKHQTE